MSPQVDPLQSPAADGPYEAPTIVRLGTLAELTLGADGGTDDGIAGGGNAGVGSI